MTDLYHRDEENLDGVQSLVPEQLETYFALMETVSLLQHSVEQQLNADGGVS